MNLSTQGSHEWVEVDSADARPGWRLPIEPGVDFGVYEYRIKALFGAEESNGWTFSDGSFSMLPHVDVLSATQGSLPGAVEITWQQVNWADYYVIHRIHNGQVNGSFVAEASASSYIDDTNGSQLVFTYAVKGGGADWISFDYGQTKTGYGGPPDL